MSAISCVHYAHAKSRALFSCTRDSTLVRNSMGKTNRGAQGMCVRVQGLSLVQFEGKLATGAYKVCAREHRLCARINVNAWCDVQCKASKTRLKGHARDSVQFEGNVARFGALVKFIAGRRVTFVEVFRKCRKGWKWLIDPRKSEWTKFSSVVIVREMHERLKLVDRYPRFEGKWCKMLKMLKFMKLVDKSKKSDASWDCERGEHVRVGFDETKAENGYNAWIWWKCTKDENNG